MKRLPLLALYTALGVCSMLNSAYSQDDTVSFDDVLLLAQSGISDRTIMTFLKVRRLDFVLDAEGIQQLREAGVSEDIIQYLLNYAYAPISVPQTYDIPISYNTSYPSYYYSTRLVGRTAFSLGWYDHRYFGLSHSTAQLGHAVGITVGHLGLSGGHISSLGGVNHVGVSGGHIVGHGGINHLTLSRGHSIGHGGINHLSLSRGHSIGHGTTHGHSRGHSGGHTRGHGSGH